MPTAQPIWKFLANLGDADPIGEGGLFVYVDDNLDSYPRTITAEEAEARYAAAMA